MPSNEVLECGEAVWRDVEGARAASGALADDEDERKDVLVSKQFEHALMIFNVTLMGAISMVAFNAFLPYASTKIPLLGIYVVLWAGQLVIVTMLFRMIYACIESLLFLAERKSQRFSFPQAASLSPPEGTSVQQQQAEALLQQRRHRKLAQQLPLISAVIRKALKFLCIITLILSVEILACLGHYGVISHIAWLIPIEMLCVAGIAKGICFNGYDLPLLVSWKWIIVFCITYTIKLNIHVLPEESREEKLDTFTGSKHGPAPAPWVYGFYSVYSLLGWWASVMLYYMGRHWYGKISLKLFQKEAITVYVVGFVAAIGSAFCYAEGMEKREVFKATPNLHNLQNDAATFFRVSVCLLLVAVACMLLAFWVVFKASIRTLQYRRGAERPMALTPMQPKDRATPHSQNRGWSWVVDEDMVHEPTWYLGDIERMGVRDDHMADSYSTSAGGGDTGFVDQKEYLTVYWMRKLMCCKPQKASDYADIPDAQSTAGGCEEQTCCCCCGARGLLCCQGGMEMTSGSGSGSDRHSRTQTGDECSAGAASETTPMLSRR